MNETYKLMTNKEITINYSNNFKIYNLFINNKNEYTSFLYYISSNFGIPYDLLKTIDKIFDVKQSDAQFYFKLRKMYESKVSIIIDKIDALYETKHITKKVNSILSIVGNNNSIKNALDIGTENDIFLDQLSKQMNISKVIGLNVNKYSHYFSYQKAVNSGKIIIYDGINFPFNNDEFDLVTMLAVLHHIPDIEIFLNALCKITKSIYIKDNDMINELAYTMVELQHELYEGILYPTPRSGLYKYTMGTVIDILKRNNFKINYVNAHNKFTRFYVLYATKN